MKNILEIDSVILEFSEKHILHDIYLKIETGNVTALLGRNGSGKSCLMKIIFGKLMPQEKSLRINGKYSNKKHLPIHILTYLPQFNFIPKSLTIKRIFKDYKNDFEDFLLFFPEFERYYQTKIARLSGGEQRIIEVYSILVSRSKFCLLDEPFSQIMPLHIDSIKELIIREKENKGILITDHLYEHIMDICNHKYILKDGAIHLIKNNDDLKLLGYIR